MKHIQTFESVNEDTVYGKKFQKVMNKIPQWDWLSDDPGESESWEEHLGIDRSKLKDYIILYSYANDNWNEVKKLLDRARIKYDEMDDPDTGEATIVFKVNESINEATYKKGDRVIISRTYKGGVGKDPDVKKGKEVTGVIGKRIKRGNRYEYVIGGITYDDDEIVGLAESVNEGKSENVKDDIYDIGGKIYKDVYTSVNLISTDKTVRVRDFERKDPKFKREVKKYIKSKGLGSQRDGNDFEIYLDKGRNFKGIPLSESVNELRTSPVSGTKAGFTTSLEDRKYELKKDVKGARIGDYVNITLPKGTIIYNLAGGVHAHHKSLERYADRNSNIYFKKGSYSGIRVRSMPELLADIEKNSKILESVNEAKDNLYLQMHKKYAEQIKGLKAKKIKKLTDLVSVQRWSMEDRDDYFDMDPKKKKELSAEYNEERKLFKKYMAGDHSVMLPKGTETLAESVNEGKFNYTKDSNSVRDLFKKITGKSGHDVLDSTTFHEKGRDGWMLNTDDTPISDNLRAKFVDAVMKLGKKKGWEIKQYGDDAIEIYESVNEAEKYDTKEFKVGDKIKTNIGVWEVIETDYKPGKSFAAPFIFKGKDMKRLNIPNPPKTNKNAVGYKVTDGDKYPIIGFLYQYKDITKLATVGVDESVNEGVYDDNAREMVFDIDNANILGNAEMELMQGGLPQARNGEVGSWPSILIWRKGYDKELYIIPKGKPGQYELYDDKGYERGKEKASGDTKKILAALKKAVKVFESVNEGTQGKFLMKGLTSKDIDTLDRLADDVSDRLSDTLPYNQWVKMDDDDKSEEVKNAIDKLADRYIGDNSYLDKLMNKKYDAVIGYIVHSLSESVNESVNKSDLAYQLSLDYSGNSKPKITKLNKKELNINYGYKTDPQDTIASFKKLYPDKELIHIEWSEGGKGGVHRFKIEESVGGGHKFVKTFEVYTQAPAKMIAFDGDDEDDEDLIKKGKKMKGPLGMATYLGIAEDDEEEESEEEKIRKREGRISGPDGGVGYAGKERG